MREPYPHTCREASLIINKCVLFKNRECYELMMSSSFYLYLVITISGLLSHVWRVIGCYCNNRKTDI